jgi:hypothetical protein
MWKVSGFLDPLRNWKAVKSDKSYDDIKKANIFGKIASF